MCGCSGGKRCEREGEKRRVAKRHGQGFEPSQKPTDDLSRGNYHWATSAVDFPHHITTIHTLQNTHSYYTHSHTPLPYTHSNNHQRSNAPTHQTTKPLALPTPSARRRRIRIRIRILFSIPGPNASAFDLDKVLVVRSRASKNLSVGIVRSTKLQAYTILCLIGSLMYFFCTLLHHQPPQSTGPNALCPRNWAGLHSRQIEPFYFPPPPSLFSSPSRAMDHPGSSRPSPFFRPPCLSVPFSFLLIVIPLPLPLLYTVPQPLF